MAELIKSKVISANSDFVRDEQDGMTALAMFWLVVCCKFAGLAIDVTNLHWQKGLITVATGLLCFADYNES